MGKGARKLKNMTWKANKAKRNEGPRRKEKQALCTASKQNEAAGDN